ncbi:MAG: hypothetical protein P4N60_19510 [Verrucomicrobiae bacterium]|nr:hypothetical protein [Verrucomicrobiae bacterium]
MACPTGAGTGDWKVAGTGRLESLPYGGAGRFREAAFMNGVKLRRQPPG